MKYKVYGDTVAVRLNRGDEILSALKKICTAEKITAGVISGIGAADYAVVGLYEVAGRRYLKNTLEGEMELTNLTGNVSQRDGQVYLHLHATFARGDGQALGGHLNEARISGVGELFIRKLPGELSRVLDPETGLNILDWEE